MSRTAIGFLYLGSAIVYAIFAGFFIDWLLSWLISNPPQWARYAVFTVVAVPFLILCGQSYDKLRNKREQ